MATFEIPLDARPQRFQIQLSGTTYLLLVTWCAPQAAWLLDILDVNELPILTGLPLQPGADLLNQFEYLGIGGQLWVQVDGDATAVPTFENLGTAGRLFYETAS